MKITIRRATTADASAISALIADSARTLGRSDYGAEIIEAALRSAWGLDTQLIEDGTYFLVDVGGELAACGGWSFRHTLFGSDSRSARDSTRLRPGVDSARIRAFFVRPAFARRGLASALLAHCEREARAAGFLSASLGATEPGRRLYRTFGYVESEPIDFDLGGGLSIPVIPMSKRLSTTGARDEVRDARREDPPNAMKNPTTVERKSERERVVTRTIDGSARLVFEAWTKSELFERWWVPKSCGLLLLSCEVDARVGGNYRLVFRHGDSDSMAFHGRYLEVTPHARLVWTNEESDSGAVTTVTFEESDGKTLLVMHDVFPSKEALDAEDGMEGALAETFDQLDELLVTLGASTAPS